MSKAKLRDWLAQHRRSQEDTIDLIPLPELTALWMKAGDNEGGAGPAERRLVAADLFNGRTPRQIKQLLLHDLMLLQGKTPEFVVNGLGKESHDTVRQYFVGEPRGEGEGSQQQAGGIRQVGEAGFPVSHYDRLQRSTRSRNGIAHGHGQEVRPMSAAEALMGRSLPRPHAVVVRGRRNEVAY